VFGFEAYHVLLAAVGASIILAFWLPRFLSGREPATSALLILAGFASFVLIPGMPAALEPVKSPRPWEVLSELCVVVGLFGTGLRIDRLAGRKQWTPTLRLLVIAMPVCILMVAFVGWTVAGMTLAGGLLLGAIMAPTDPGWPATSRSGPPHEGGEHPVRFTLTDRSGPERWPGFPFVHLGIADRNRRRPHLRPSRRVDRTRPHLPGHRRGGGGRGRWLAARQGAVRLAAGEPLSKTAPA
jgi:hypothetical protein